MWIRDQGAALLAKMYLRSLTWAKLAGRFRCSRHNLFRWQQGQIEINDDLARSILVFVGLAPGKSECTQPSDAEIQRANMAKRYDLRRGKYRPDLTVITPEESAKIRANMARLELSQTELASRLKRKGHTVANWLYGRTGLAVVDKQKLMEIVCLGEKIGANNG